jgi:hypothetical protein
MRHANGKCVGDNMIFSWRQAMAHFPTKIRTESQEVAYKHYRHIRYAIVEGLCTTMILPEDAKVTVSTIPHVGLTGETIQVSDDATGYGWGFAFSDLANTFKVSIRGRTVKIKPAVYVWLVKAEEECVFDNADEAEAWIEDSQWPLSTLIKVRKGNMSKIKDIKHLWLVSTEGGVLAFDSMQEAGKWIDKKIDKKTPSRVEIRRVRKG